MISTSWAERSAAPDDALRADTLRLLRMLLDDSPDGALALSASGCRVYSNRALDAIVATDARRPIGTAAPPPYVPSDQHREYWRILGETTYVRDGGQLATAALELVSREHHRTRVQLTVLPFRLADDNPLAVWLVRPVRSEGEALRLPAPAPFAPELAVLTRREREVLHLLVGGRRVASIARRLYVSEHTVRNHLKSIFRKLHADSQAELIDRYGAP